MEVTAETLIWLAAALLGLVVLGFLLVAARRLKIGPRGTVRGRDRSGRTGIGAPRSDREESEQIW